MGLKNTHYIKIDITKALKLQFPLLVCALS